MQRVKSLVRLFSVLYLAILCILWASSWWPSALWWLATLFQMAPLWVLYFPVGFLFMAGLLVKGKRAIAVNILSFIVIIFCIMGFNVSFSMPGQRNAKTQNTLRIMTCNLGTNFDVSALSEFISRTRPDIIALQDAYAYNQKALESVLDQGKWDMTFNEDLGLASRLKIKNVDVKNKKILGGKGGLVGKYELEWPMGRIHFFNVHLETPRKGLEAIINNRLGWLSKIRRVAELQEKESSIVSQWITPHKVVLIAGDFNMSEANPIYKKYWSRLSNAFSKAGFGFGYTYYTGWHGIRIDRILYDSDWRIIHFQVGPDIGTEHRPVVADVEFIGKQLKVEEPQEQIAIDNTMLVFENFEMSLGVFEDYGTANTSIDNQTRYLHGNTLKIERNTALDYVSSGIKLDLWCFENYPIVSFAYMIPKGVPLRMRVKTIYNDWIVLDGTREDELIDDGEWHEIRIDVGSTVKSALPDLKYLTEFQFYIDENRYQKNAFWIDDFKISRN